MAAANFQDFGTAIIRKLIMGSLSPGWSAPALAGVASEASEGRRNRLFELPRSLHAPTSRSRFRQTFRTTHRSPSGAPGECPGLIATWSRTRRLAPPLAVTANLRTGRRACAGGHQRLTAAVRQALRSRLACGRRATILQRRFRSPAAATVSGTSRMDRQGARSGTNSSCWVSNIAGSIREIAVLEASVTADQLLITRLKRRN